MDRSTFNRHIDIPTIYHQLKPRLSSLSSSTGTHPTNIRNATITRKPTTGTCPTTTNINALSTNDNNPVNHQPIRHSKRLESQRRMSVLASKHLTLRYPHTSDEDSKHRSRKLKIINSKSKEQNNLTIIIIIIIIVIIIIIYIYNV